MTPERALQLAVQFCHKAGQEAADGSFFEDIFDEVDDAASKHQTEVPAKKTTATSRSASGDIGLLDVLAGVLWAKQHVAEAEGERPSPLEKEYVCTVHDALKKELENSALAAHVQWWRAGIMNDGNDGRLKPGENEVSFVRRGVLKCFGEEQAPLKTLTKNWNALFKGMGGGTKAVLQSTPGYFAMQFPCFFMFGEGDISDKGPHWPGGPVEKIKDVAPQQYAAHLMYHYTGNF